MLKTMKGYSLPATMLSAMFTLSACGGGGGDSGTSSSSGSSGGGTLKGGLFETEVTYANGDPDQSPVTYYSPTRRFVTVFGGDSALSFGRFALDGSRLNGRSIDYRQLESSEQQNTEGFIENKGGQEGAINGTVNSQSSANFRTADALGDVKSTANMRRLGLLSDLGISLSRASGTYVRGESTVALDVGADGSLFAQYPEIGCTLNGTLSVPNASINVFDIDYTLSGCSLERRDGDYSGAGYFVLQTDQMQIAFAAHNGIVAMKFKGSR